MPRRARPTCVNDARDVASDRKHPTKRNRPIAAGVVPVGLAYGLAALLLAIALVGAFATAIDFGWVLLAYMALTTAYTYRLKAVPVLDIVAVAAGFVLRAVGGAAAAASADLGVVLHRDVLRRPVHGDRQAPR